MIRSLKVCILIGPFHANYITFDLKKYGGVIFYDNKESCKIFRKTELWLGRWHEKFDRFSSEHLKMSKLVLSWDPLSFQNWHKEVDKFWLKHWKVSKIYTLMGYFWPKYTIFGLRMYREVIIDGTQDWYKVWRKTNLSFQK